MSRPSLLLGTLVALALRAAPLAAQQPAAQQAQHPAQHPAQHRARPPAPTAGLDPYIEHAMHDWHVPGLAIAIVHNDSVVLARGYGVRHIGTPDRVDPHTIFAIGSNTKAFTATAIAMMVDSGRMHWDDRATQYLPGFQLYDPWVTREITVRDLLSHRSGLGRRGDLLWYGSPYSRAEILRRIRYLPPNSSFRSQFGYSNIMVLAAGQALAAAAGTSWDDVIAQRIFTPLGMTSSSTSIAAFSRETDVATPHSIDKGIARAIPWRNVDNIGPAGSINSTVTDMAQWIRLQLGNGTYAGRQLVSARSLRETHSPQTIISSPHDSLTPSTHFALYGMGWVLEDYRGREIIWHNGGIDGMLSEVRLVPEAHLGIVILSNAEGHNLNPALMYRIIDAYLGAPARDWSALYLARFKRAQAAQEAAEQKMLAARVTGTKPSLPLADYVGTYADTMYGKATVALEHNALILRYGPAFTGDLAHWNFDTFRVTWRDPRLGAGFVTFGLGAMGTVDHMNVEGITDFHFVPDTASSHTAALHSPPR